MERKGETRFESVMLRGEVTLRALIGLWAFRWQKPVAYRSSISLGHANSHMTGVSDQQQGSCRLRHPFRLNRLPPMHQD